MPSGFAEECTLLRPYRALCLVSCVLYHTLREDKTEKHAQKTEISGTDRRQAQN